MLARLQRNERAVFGVCLAFSLLLLAFFVVTPHLASPLRDYLIFFVLTGIAFVAYQQLGVRQDRNYLRNATTFNVLSILGLYAIGTYIAGIFLGFSRGLTPKTPAELFSAFVPTLLLAVSVELLRYIVSEQYLYSRRSVVIFTTLTALMYILLELPYAKLGEAELVFIFICATVLPIIAREALCGFLSYRAGLRPTMIYKLAMVLYPFLPIIPNLGDYIHSVLGVVVPFLIYIATLRSARLLGEDKKRLRQMNYRMITIPILSIGAVLTALVSGLTPLQLIAVGSDSMRPVYARGDAVVFEKVNASDIEKDDILVFRKEKTIITHRVTAIENRNGTLYFTTRGDNNEKEDGFETSSAQVLGRVISVGKYIGFPTVWLNEIFAKG